MPLLAAFSAWLAAMPLARAQGWTDAALTPLLAPTPADPTARPRVLAMPDDPFRAPPGALRLASGSGFFAGPHTVLTAAHVVAGCQTIALASPHLVPGSDGVTARVVLVDEAHDIAVLHSEAGAPAVLALGMAAPGAVRVIGFAGAARRGATAAESWAGLANAQIAPATALERDPAQLLWLQDRSIAPGHSGGPILDPGGRVVGLVRATLDPALAARHYGIALPDLAIGPGVAPLRAMLGADDTAAAPAPAPDAATRAVVAVLCWQ